MKSFKEWFSDEEIENIELMIDAMDGLIIEDQRAKCFDLLDDLLNNRIEINQLSEECLNQFIKEYEYFVKTTETFIETSFFKKITSVLKFMIDGTIEK